ncbi:Nucleotide-binding universal stress protein, UspA family [Halogranum rubrum]|uniref:Nucleotide-binding universal stress protein, UspA family n=1 Tax=Halogranum rubrum TaxID=553466 RepID=A0A1I4BK06_9EURY|nr:universal stress protein [Halogranum rubrum]SFK68527.1 Nucleotide-binding universal stress protein, UspA family [Halogranum rubrum]
MFDGVLFPTDGSEGTIPTLEHALDVASTHGATLHLLYVADTTRDSVTQIHGEIVDALEAVGEDVLDDAAERARRRGVTTVTEIRQGEPYREIVGYATATDLDLVIMPTRGRSGLGRLLLGSTTERVVRRSDVPVLTIRPDADATQTDHSYPYRNVLVPTDGSTCAETAVALGIDLSAVDDATLHLLSVVDIASLGMDTRVELQIEGFEQRAEETVADAATTAREGGVETVTTAVETSTSIHRAILSYVENHDIDVVVVGTHGRTGFDRYLLGSVTEKLVRTSPVPVLTVRESVEE